MMSSSSTEASQPLISSISQQVTANYTAPPQPMNAAWSLTPSAPSVPSASSRPKARSHPRRPPPPPAEPPSTSWSTLSCPPFNRSGGGHRGGDHTDKEMLPTNIVYKNWDRSNFTDMYYWALRLEWMPFTIAAFVVFFAQVLLFALINWLLDLHTTSTLSFAELLLLHLYVSAGYGTGSFVIEGNKEHTLLSIESLSRTIYFTLVTGILYARFSKPIPRIRFGSHVFICKLHGQRSLVIRLANDRLESLINTQVQMVMSMSSITQEGKPWRHFYNLELTRSTIPTFLFPWSLQHKLDASSPLHSLTHAQWRDAKVDLHAVVSAVDSVFGGTIWARHRYQNTDVRFGWRPADVFTNLHADEQARAGANGHQPVRVIDMAKFDQMERDESDPDDIDEDDDEEQDELSA